MKLLLLRGPDGRRYIAEQIELSNSVWDYDRESWLVTEFGPRIGSDVLPSDWWDKDAINHWGRSQTYDNLDAFAILASH
jgi:hypothetical protein